MRFISKKTVWEKEWAILIKRENGLLKRQEVFRTSLINEKLKEVIPNDLQEKLDLAFEKAFEVVFEKGTAVIERTYDKEKWENQYKINEFTVGLKQNRRNMKAFSKQADMANMKNLLVSGVEGVGLGVLGIGIPDIPLFVGMLLKSVYEIAISYGYSYDTREEQILILKIIRGSLEHGEELVSINQELDGMLKGESLVSGEGKEDIRRTAKALSKELLYMKFLQGIPVAGVIGGLSDAVCLKKVTNYAMIKYKKRFLWKYDK